MTLNRLITTLVQLAFGLPTLWLAREMYRDIKENGLFGDLNHDE